MHPLHKALSRQLHEQLVRHRVVVWYDRQQEFQPFITELRGEEDAPASGAARVRPVTLEHKPVHLVEFTGSFFGVRAAIEPLVAGEAPEPLLIYVPGVAYDEKTSVLLEVEKAGHLFERELHKVARSLLRRDHGESDIDRLLPSRKLTYEDVARLVSQAERYLPASLLRTLFPEAGASPEELLAAWLAGPAQDAAIGAKGATDELLALLQARLGLEPPGEASLQRLRAITLRHVLVGELRADLRAPPPASLQAVPPVAEEHVGTVRQVASALRAHHAGAYAGLADSLEQELRLASLDLPAAALGAIDTFRFEERALLRHCGELLAGDELDAALVLIHERARSFWLDRDVQRKAQWEACRRMAELGVQVARVRRALEAERREAGTWLAAYAAEDGWFRMDQAQRRLEAFIASMDEDPEAERALSRVRRAYEAVCARMAEGFSQALLRARWHVPGMLSQTAVYATVLGERPRPVAYFLVDALRYEMGVELVGRLPQALDLSIRPAMTALPSITPVGMAALLPGASASFDVVAQGGRLGARIEGTFLSDLTSRKKHLAARVPGMVDLTLDTLLRTPASRLGKTLAEAPLVIIRSQEIDKAGEDGGGLQARQAMDTVIDNLARAVRKLAAAGLEHFVISADHGHHFSAEPKDESMRVEAPGGETVELHRRCWVGRGGATPPGCVRVTGAELGYATDLDFVFPTGTGVFRAGGDLAFHHGGASLQELLVPVLAFRMKPGGGAPRGEKGRVTVTGLPDAITNRIFSVVLTPGDSNLSLLPGKALSVRPALMCGDRTVGGAGMAVGGELDRATGCLSLVPGSPVTVGFLLKDDTVDKLRVVVQDPATDAVLFQSAELPVRPR
jgi:hypothetical protein